MKIKLNSIVFFSLFVFFFLALSSEVQAYYGPKAYVTEYVSQDYWWNGTAKSADIRRGQAEVSVPNNADVLQYVRVNTTRTNTDIQNMFYDNVVASLSADAKDPIYANITNYNQAAYYNITNVSASPTINLSLNYTNYFGGTDIYDSDNIGTGGSTNTLRFNFTIRNPSTDISLSGVSVTLNFALDTGGTRDVVNISAGTNSTTADGGSTTTATYMSNSDGVDSDYDRYTWTGTLGPSGLVYIIFNATLLEGAGGNIADGDNDEDLDGTSDKGGLGNYSSSSTLSGIAINYKLSRGSIRQGVDLQISSGTWYARGSIKNSGSAGSPYLTYNVTAWRIYTVDPSTGAPYSNANQSGTFNKTGTSSYISPADSTIYTTDSSRSSNESWYNTSASSTKPYIASYFDWYVVWNDTQSEFHAGYINTTMDMQTLYKVDQVDTKALSGVIYPATGGQPVTVNDTVYYTGSPSIASHYIRIYSIIPVNNTNNVYHGRFEINTSTIKVYFYNSSGTCSTGCQLGVGNYSQTATNPTPYGQNGTLLITITDLSAAYIEGTSNRIGRNLSASGDRIVLIYNVLSNVSMDTGDTYVFTGNSTLNTTSGTLESESHQSQSITVSARRLQGYKELIAPYPANPTLINATLFVEVQAQGSEYISGIKFLDYVVNGTFNNNATRYGQTINATFFNGAGTDTWVYLTNYNVTFNGTRQLNDSTWVEVFEFINITAGSGGGFTLNNTQNITVRYQMNVTTAGTYILPLQIAAFDPTTGESFFAESWGVIRVDLPEPSLPLQITDHSLELAKRVVVGTPAIWIKNFEVYNPNARVIPSKFQTEVFGDAMQGFVSYYNDRGEKIEENVVFGNVENGKKSMSWESNLNPMETRTYEVRILTPPVMEIDRDVEVLDKLENKMVKLKMDIFLKSFAEEKYSNLVLNLPLGYENILEVKDGFGRPMQFTGSKDTSSIIVDEIEPSGMKTISVIYKASYPTIIITPDRDRYDLSAPVNLEILVINGGETIDYPYLEVEIYTPGMDVIYSNLERLNSMEPLEKTQNYQKFVIPANAPGGMYVASAKFREDFTVLASGTGNFLVVGAGVSTPEALQIIAVLSVTLVLVYFSLKRFREIKRTKGILESTAPMS